MTGEKLTPIEWRMTVLTEAAAAVAQEIGKTPEDKEFLQRLLKGAANRGGELLQDYQEQSSFYPNVIRVIEDQVPPLPGWQRLRVAHITENPYFQWLKLISGQNTHGEYGTLNSLHSVETAIVSNNEGLVWKIGNEKKEGRRAVYFKKEEGEPQFETSAFWMETGPTRVSERYVEIMPAVAIEGKLPEAGAYSAFPQPFINRARERNPERMLLSISLNEAMLYGNGWDSRVDATNRAFYVLQGDIFKLWGIVNRVDWVSENSRFPIRWSHLALEGEKHLGLEEGKHRPKPSDQDIGFLSFSDQEGSAENWAYWGLKREKQSRFYVWPEKPNLLNISHLICKDDVLKISPVGPVRTKVPFTIPTEAVRRFFLYATDLPQMGITPA